MAVLSNLKVNNTSYDINAKTLGGLESKDFVKAFSSDSIASVRKLNSAHYYAKLATLTITTTYPSYPIIFEVYARNIPHSFISILFKDDTVNQDPDINTFTTTNSTNFYLKKISTSTWVLYYKFIYTGDYIYIRQCFGAHVNNGVNIVFDMETIPSIPEGCIQVVNGVTANKAETSNSITNLGRLASANVATIGDKKVTVFQSSSSMTSGKPSGDGYIMNFNWDNSNNFSSQLFIPQNYQTSNLSIQYRKSNGVTWSTQPWITVLDTDNTKLVNGGNIMINGTSRMLGVDITPYLQAGKVLPFSATYRYGNYPVECKIIEDSYSWLYIGVKRDDSKTNIPITTVYEFHESDNGWSYSDRYDQSSDGHEYVDCLFSQKNPIILTMGSEENTDNNEDFKSFATDTNLSLINKAIEEKNPCVFVKGYDVDGYFLSHVTINTDGADVFVRVHGNPYRWDTDDASTNIIAVDYYIYNDQWDGYELVTASVGNRISLRQ